MPFAGHYTKADIAKKLSGSIMRLGKNRLQESVYLACDAIGMIQNEHPEAVGQAVVLNASVPLGALVEGDAGRGFAVAVIAEALGSAIGRLYGDRWSDAVTEIRRALEMMKRRADGKNVTLHIRTTPDALARHEEG